MGKTNDCALQHIKVFREQAINKKQADFGEPCQKCIHAGECDFEWLSILSPLLNQSNINISMVDQGLNPQRDKSQSEIVMDTDIRFHKGMKTE